MGNGNSLTDRFKSKLQTKNLKVAEDKAVEAHRDCRETTDKRVKRKHENSIGEVCDRVKTTTGNKRKTSSAEGREVKANQFNQLVSRFGEPGRPCHRTGQQVPACYEWSPSRKQENDLLIGRNLEPDHAIITQANASKEMC